MAPGPDALWSRHYQILVYALTLVRYLGPGSDGKVLEERADLIEETCSRVNGFGEILHKPISLLEHGRPKRRGPVYYPRVDLPPP